MSERLTDTGNKRADKNTSNFECQSHLCLPKEKTLERHDFHFGLCFHLTQVRIKSLFHLTIPILF